MNQNNNGPINQNGQPMPNMNNHLGAAPNGMPNQPGGNQQMQQPNNASQFIKRTDNQTTSTKKKKNVMSKELVTILGVIAIVAILYFTYNYQLNKNLELQTSIPIANGKILPGTRITSENIKYIEVPASTLNEIKAITNAQDIIDKYVNYDTMIPENSFFYSEILSATDTAPNSRFKDLLENDAAIMIDVDLQKTYGNSIMPGDVVDIYADATVPNKKGEIEYIAGPLVTGAKVLAVIDGSGNDVFANHENKLTPAYFIFTLDSDIIKLIRKAQKLSVSTYAMSLYPVIDGKSYKSDGTSTLVNESQITELIKQATIDIKDNN